MSRPRALKSGMFPDTTGSVDGKLPGEDHDATPERKVTDFYTMRG